MYTVLKLIRSGFIGVELVSYIIYYKVYIV